MAIEPRTHGPLRLGWELRGAPPSSAATEAELRHDLAADLALAVESSDGWIDLSPPSHVASLVDVVCGLGEAVIELASGEAAASVGIGQADAWIELHRDGGSIAVSATYATGRALVAEAALRDATARFRADLAADLRRWFPSLASNPAMAALFGS